MSKDPAVSWYWNDWAGGTQGMSREEKGAYMEVLQAQHSRGSVPLSFIQRIFGADFDRLWPLISEKFKSDADGFYNVRLRDEIQKRRAYSESRANNRKKKEEAKTAENQPNDQKPNNISKSYEKDMKTYDEHMGIGNGIGIGNNIEVTQSSEVSISSIGGMQGGNYEPDFWENFYNDFRNAYGAYGYPYKRWDVIEHLRGAVANVLGKWKEMNIQGDYHDAAEFLTQCANLAQQADTNAKRDKRKAPHNWLADHNYLTNPADILPKKKTESELLREAITKAAQNIKP